MAFPPETSAVNQIKSHTRRKMTVQEKLDYKRRRQLKACSACATSKKKCNHNTLAQAHYPISNLEKSCSAFESFEGKAIGLTIRPRTPREDLRTSIKLNDDALVKPIGFALDKPLGAVRRIHEDDEESQHKDVLDNSFPFHTKLCSHKPQSPEDLSVMIFAENVVWAGIGDSWFGEAPVRLGHDTCYDLAIDALTMSCWYRRKLPGATLAKVCRAMSISLDALHVAMSREGAVFNDHILTTAAALSPVDAIMGGHSFLVPSHLDGVAMILASQAAAVTLSRLARRILEFHFCDTYVLATVRGTVSPFESIDPSYCEDLDLSKPAAERKLREIGHKLCVRLPRLITLVRLACGPHSSGSKISSALDLAAELVQFQDDSAESEFLHDVGVTPTKLPQDWKVTKYSLTFKSFSSFEAGLCYWHTRTTLVRLCSRLRSTFPTLCDMYALPTMLELQDEQQRDAANMVMCLQYARTNTARKRRRLLGQSLLTCWSTLQDYPEATTSGCDADEMRSWLLENLNITLLAQPSSLEQHDFDQATELFRGGPLVRKYRDLYDPPTLDSCLGMSPQSVSAS